MMWVQIPTAHLKSGMVLHVPIILHYGVETGGWLLWLVGCQPRAKFSGSPCLRDNVGRERMGCPNLSSGFWAPCEHRCTCTRVHAHTLVSRLCYLCFYLSHMWLNFLFYKMFHSWGLTWPSSRLWESLAFFSGDPTCQVSWQSLLSVFLGAKITNLCFSQDVLFPWPTA